MAMKKVIILFIIMVVGLSCKKEEIQEPFKACDVRLKIHAKNFLIFNWGVNYEDDGKVIMNNKYPYQYNYDIDTVLHFTKPATIHIKLITDDKPEYKIESEVYIIRGDSVALAKNIPNISWGYRVR